MHQINVCAALFLNIILLYLFIFLFLAEGHVFDDQASEESFLFSLKNPSGYPPEKILPFPDLHSEDACVKGAVKSRADFGPTFGEYGNIIDLSTLTGKNKSRGFCKNKTRLSNKVYRRTRLLQRI